MNKLEAAMEEIQQARSDVSKTEDRTKLESVTTSLEEMRDTAIGEPTDPDGTFGDTEVEGVAPARDNLIELEKSIGGLADNVEQQEVQRHLETAREHIAQYRTETGE